MRVKFWKSLRKIKKRQNGQYIKLIQITSSKGVVSQKFFHSLPKKVKSDLVVVGSIPKLGEAAGNILLGFLCASTQLSASQTRSVSSRRPSHRTGGYAVLRLLSMIPSSKGTLKETSSNPLTWKCKPAIGFSLKIGYPIPWFIMISS